MSVSIVDSGSLKSEASTDIAKLVKMWTATLTLLFFVLVVMSPDRNLMRALQKVSAVPLGTTSEYYDDIVSTTELVYNLILGSNCNHRTSKAGL